LLHSVLWTGQEIAKAVSGRLINDFKATGVSIDSRTLKAGDLFVAIQGPKVDGHHFVKSALAAGAGGAIVTHIPEGCDPQAPLVVVENTERALEELGHASRQRTHAKVLAVTGSFGKTGTKEALRHVLSKQGKTSATQSSFNNLWGVPLTLARVHADDDYAIIELGMNHAGELTPLSQQVRPDVAMITNVGEMHLVHFGTIEKVADAKAEIFNGVVAGGKAILNRDNSQFERLAAYAQQKQLQLLTFGQQNKADFQVTDVKSLSHGFEVTASTPVGVITYTINLLGEHWILNSIGVLAMVYAAGADVERAAQDFASFELFDGRGQIHKVSYKGDVLTVINDSYNAGPDSMKAALKVLGKIQPGPQGRRVAILGDMLELGEKSQAYHEALLPVLMEQQVDVVFTCGPEMQNLWKLLPANKQGIHDNDIDALVTQVMQRLQPGDVVIAKGSRGQREYRGRMSKFIDAMLALDAKGQKTA
jgi:UDP-N-acetylmuramoyl-tripeptide--D-alanyl-D-alanine ligase